MRINFMPCRPLAVSALALMLAAAGGSLAWAQTQQQPSQFGPRAGKTGQQGQGQAPNVEVIATHGQWKIQCEAAPAAFRFTYPTSPERHEEAARLLTDRRHGDGIDALPDAISTLCRDVGTPRNLAEYGFDLDDVESIVEGALKQQRLLAVSPRPVTRNGLAAIVRRSLGT